MNNAAIEQELRTRPLKQVFADVDLRIKYRERKMQGVKSEFIFIRLEPLANQNKLKDRLCINIISPPHHEMSSLIGILRERLLKSGLNQKFIENSGALFLFKDKKLMTSFTQKVISYHLRNILLRHPFQKSPGFDRII